MNISTRQLNAFIATAKNRNFSRAAEDVFMTQAGLSLLIKDLETQLGFRLFNRTTRHVSLTTSGTKFFVIALRIKEQLEETVNEITESLSETNRWIAIGAPPMTSIYFLSEAMSLFKKNDENYRFRLYDGDLLNIVEKVITGELDLGLGMFMKTIPEVTIQSLMSFPLFAVRRKIPLSVERTEISWKELAGETLISLPPENPLQQLIEKTLRNAKCRTQQEFVVNYIGTQIALAEAGEGTAILAGWIANTIRSNKLEIVKLVDPVIEVNLSLIKARGRNNTAAQRFIEFLEKYSIKWSI